MSIAEMRQEYEGSPLHESNVAADAVEQFQHWFEQAKEGGVREPNAMTLATAGPDGRPSARIVLLKGIERGGFVFYTSYISRKAADLADNPQASLVFWWEAQARQVIVEGGVSRVSRRASEQYFASRPRGSQIGAWASHQSRAVSSHDELVRRFAELESQYEGQTVPTPPFWGGYRLHPQMIEFWQGQPSRLHQRLRYQREPAGTWRIERVSP